MGLFTKALVASVLLVQATGGMAMSREDDTAMCAAKTYEQRSQEERQRCATLAWENSPEFAAQAARSNLAGGIVVGTILLATVIVAVTGGNDGLDTVAVVPPIVPPIATTTTTTTRTTSTATSTR